MDYAAQKFARRILLIHLALLAGVIAVVFFASREVYKQTREEATEQAKSRRIDIARRQDSDTALSSGGHKTISGQAADGEQPVGPVAT